jgi:ABC-type lipoprotein export system ATPase subunit
VDDPRVEPAHCLICRGDRENFWVVDKGTAAGTFLNCCAVVAARLQSGDILQLGRFAWIYNAADHFLVPLDRIAGAAIEARGVALARRIEPLDLTIPGGQFVAIVGPSNSGKSSLLRALLAAPGSRDAGSVTIGGLDADLERDAFRAQFSYVSQKDVLHDDLPAETAIRFSALVRGKPAPRGAVNRLLRRLDVRRVRWRAKPKHLSGGELKRVRVAAELATMPPCLLLDEPTSGLDFEREGELMRLLRGLSYQGCTIVRSSIGSWGYAKAGKYLTVHRVTCWRKSAATGDGRTFRMRRSPSPLSIGPNLFEPPSATTSTYRVS